MYHKNYLGLLVRLHPLTRFFSLFVFEWVSYYAYYVVFYILVEARIPNTAVVRSPSTKYPERAV